jgi:hypothetical protein
LRHVGFVIWRLCKKVFHPHLQRHGEDMLSAAIPLLYQKVRTYNLNYRDRDGNKRPVRFSSYICAHSSHAPPPVRDMSRQRSGRNPASS